MSDARGEVIIVGAGLAGLVCARRLAEAGRPVLVLEAAEVPGGRVATREVDGFRLDAGFQVLLTAYPEARRWLDYNALALGRFRPGARIWTGQKQCRIADPFRDPLGALASLSAPVGGWGDRFRILAWRRQVFSRPWPSLFDGPEETTSALLARLGFSEAMVEGFLRPWLGGILLDPALQVSGKMASFAFRMLAEGDAALPADGMASIPRQLAAGLPSGTLRCGARVAAVEPGAVTLVGGERLPAAAVVVAVDGESAAALVPGRPPVEWRSTTVAYFDAPASPLGGARDLVLNGSRTGRVNSVVVPSDVARGYAPAGRALVSVSLRAGDAGGTDWGDVLKAELRAWFGAQVDVWRPLDLIRVPRALPVRAPMRREGTLRVRDGIWLCGDLVSTPSIQGAMESGRAAAEAVLGG